MIINYKAKVYTLYDIKLIAAFVMVLDHLGIIFDFTSFRWVGRFAFPLFAYLFVNGVINTSSFINYYFRLLCFALISQITYSVFLSFNRIPVNLNILFLFVVTFPMIYYLKPCYAKRPNWLAIILSFLLAVIFSYYLDYGIYGVSLIFAINCFMYMQFTDAFIVWSVPNVFHYLLLGGYQFIVLPLPFLFKYFKKLPVGEKARWFYWFYPVHFIPLIFLKYVTSL